MRVSTSGSIRKLETAGGNDPARNEKWVPRIHITATSASTSRWLHPVAVCSLPQRCVHLNSNQGDALSNRSSTRRHLLQSGRWVNSHRVRDLFPQRGRNIPRQAARTHSSRKQGERLRPVCSAHQPPFVHRSRQNVAVGWRTVSPGQ